MTSQEPEQTQIPDEKNLICLEHSNIAKMKCLYDGCLNSLICQSPSCLKLHFHRQNNCKLLVEPIHQKDYYHIE